jgi:hypothetical protein
MQIFDLDNISKTGNEDEVSIPEYFADKLRMQGCIWAFCTLLRNTDDPEIIYFMYRQIIESGYHNDVPEGKNFFPIFMLEHAANNNVDGKLQFQKMIWILKEYDDDDWALFSGATGTPKV